MRRTAAVQSGLAGVSLLLVASMGGGFLALPLLVPLHVWAARRSGAVGRVLWSLLPVTTAAMVTWAAVYVTVGETKPAIWLVPLLAAVLAGVGMVRLSGGSTAAGLGPGPEDDEPGLTAVRAASWTLIAAASMVAVLLALGIQVAIARA